MISPVVSPSSPAARSAGSMSSRCTSSKSMLLPPESFFVPNGRMTNARDISIALPGRRPLIHSVGGGDISRHS